MKNLTDYILTVKNVLEPEEFYKLLDYCKATHFPRGEVHSPKITTFHQDVQRGMIDFTQEENEISNLIRDAFIYGLEKSKEFYDYLIPNEDIEYIDYGFGFYRYVSGYWLLKYDVGDYMLSHSDFDGEAGSITMTLNINDDFEGGDFVFWDEYQLPKIKNSLHIFPSCFLYPHKVTKITKGTRYSAITWFGYNKGSRSI